MDTRFEFLAICCSHRAVLLERLCASIIREVAMVISKRSVLLVFAAILILSLLVACGQSNGEATIEQQQSSASSAKTSEPAEGQTPVPTLAELPSSAADSSGEAAVDQAGTSPPQDFGAMLAALGSYELVVGTTFNGQDAAGLPVRFEWQSRSTVTTNPPGYRLDLSTSGDDQQGGVHSMTLVRSDELSHLYLPSVGCVAGAGADFAGYLDLPLDPAELLKGLSIAEPVADGVEANGLLTAEYRFDEGTLEWFSAGPWMVDGTAHVTQDTNLMTRVVLTISGQGDLLDEGRDLNGTYLVTIDVTDLDESAAVEVPDACQQGLPYPVTGDAFDISTIGDLLAFKSRMPLVDVVDYYLAEMPAGGWRLSGEPEVFDDLAFFDYERDGQQIMITIETGPEMDTVSVLISP